MDVLILNWVDYTIIGIIVFSVIVSLIRGFIREAFSLATWIAAFWIAIAFFSPLDEQLINYISNPSVRKVAAFLALFVSTLLLGSMINFVCAQLVKKSGLSSTDRMLGIVFGAGRGILVTALMLLLVEFVHMENEPAWQNSVLVSHFQPVTVWLGKLLPEDVTKTTGMRDSLNPELKGRESPALVNN